MSDEDAYIALALNSAHGELHPLERGVHALGEPGKSVKAYAAQVGREQEVRSVQREVEAAEVAAEVGHMANLEDHWRSLSELHAAPRWLRRHFISRRAAEG